MARLDIDRDRDGWYHFTRPNNLPDAAVTVHSGRYKTYPQAKRAIKPPDTFNNAGWLHKLLSWNWYGHISDKFPEWEIDSDNTPAFIKLAHVNKQSTSSHDLAVDWDSLTTTDFYQRDWTEDGIPFVSENETYWSGWWFQTITERDRFIEWCKDKL